MKIKTILIWILFYIVFCLFLGWLNYKIFWHPFLESRNKELKTLASEIEVIKRQSELLRNILENRYKLAPLGTKESHIYIKLCDEIQMNYKEFLKLKDEYAQTLVDRMIILRKLNEIDRIENYRFIGGSL